MDCVGSDVEHLDSTPSLPRIRHALAAIHGAVRHTVACKCRAWQPSNMMHGTLA